MSEPAGYKPDDVEEPIDRWIHRPLADRLVVQPLLPMTFISPNHVTLASGALSLAAGLGWATGQPRLAAVLLFGSIVLDCADGQLARRRGTASRFGRMLDGAIDGVAPTAVLLGMAFHLSRDVHGPLPWLAAAAAGVSLGWHAVRYDAHKSVYLGAARPDVRLGGAPVQDASELAAEARACFAKRQWWRALVLAIGASWTKRQRRWLRGWRDGAYAWPQSPEERSLAAEHLRGPMRATRWLGFGLHMFLLCAAGLHPQGPWWVWGVIVGPLNLWALVTGRAWQRAEATYLSALRQRRPPPGPR